MVVNSILKGLFYEIIGRFFPFALSKKNKKFIYQAPEIAVVIDLLDIRRLEAASVFCATRVESMWGYIYMLDGYKLPSAAQVQMYMLHMFYPIGRNLCQIYSR